MWTEYRWIIQRDTEGDTAGNEMNIWHSVIELFERTFIVVSKE